MRIKSHWISVCILVVACTLAFSLPASGANLGSLKITPDVSTGVAVYSGCGNFTPTVLNPAPATIVAVSPAVGDFTVTTRDLGGGQWEFCAQSSNMNLFKLDAGSPNTIVAIIDDQSNTDHINVIVDVPYMISQRAAPNPLPHVPTPFPLGKGAFVGTIDVYYLSTGGAGAGPSGFAPVAVQFVAGTTYNDCQYYDIVTNSNVVLSLMLVPTATGTWSHTLDHSAIPTGTTVLEICPQVISPAGVSSGDKIAEIHVIARLTGPVPAGDVILLTTSSGGGDVQAPGEGAYFYATNASVAVTALPSGGAVFRGWSGTAVSGGHVANPLATTTTVSMVANLTLHANFNSNVYSPESIPTLTQWGMLVLGLIMAGMALWALRRRKSTR